MLLLIPIASAQWLVSVSSSPFSAEFFVVADSNGCVHVIDGSIRAVYEFNGSSFVREGAGNEICTYGGTILRIEASPSVFAQFPRSVVEVRDSVLSSVSHYNVANRTFVSVSPDFTPFFVALILMALLALFLFLVKRNHNAKPNTLESAVLSYIAEHPGCTQKDISKALGLEKYQVSRILSRLEKEGKVVRIRRGISKRVYLSEQLQ
jgi:hypothetical protein